MQLTDDQLLNVAKAMVKNISNQNANGVMENMQQLGFVMPAGGIQQGPSPEEIAAYQASMQQTAPPPPPPPQHYQTPNPAPFVNPYQNQFKKQQVEMAKLKAEQDKRIKDLENQLKEAETQTHARELYEKTSSYVKSNLDKYPALKSVDPDKLVEHVLNIRDYDIRNKKNGEETLTLKEILDTVHDETADQVNTYIKDDAQKIKHVREPEPDENEVRDVDGNLVGKLNEEGKLVRTISEPGASQGDSTVANKDDKKEPMLKDDGYDEAGENAKKHVEQIQNADDMVDGEITVDEKSLGKETYDSVSKILSDVDARGEGGQKDG